MFNYDENTKGVFVWLLSGIGTAIGMLFLWIAKTTHEKWRLIIKWHDLNREINMALLSNKVSLLENELTSVKLSITKGLSDQREFIDLKLGLLIQSVEHMNDNNKHSMGLMNENMEKEYEINKERLNRIEDKLNR